MKMEVWYYDTTVSKSNWNYTFCDAKDAKALETSGLYWLVMHQYKSEGMGEEEGEEEDQEEGG